LAKRKHKRKDKKKKPKKSEDEEDRENIQLDTLFLTIAEELYTKD
jgi:hypothetical protein